MIKIAPYKFHVKEIFGGLVVIQSVFHDKEIP